MKKIFDYIVDETEYILARLQGLITYIPSNQIEDAKKIFSIFIYLLIVLVCGLLIFKFFQLFWSWFKLVKKWIGEIASGIEDILRNTIISKLKISIIGIFDVQTYKKFFDWCSMTDKEVVVGFKLDDGTSPRMIQRQLGFVVLLATIWAFLGAFLGALFSLASDNNFGELSASQIFGVGVISIIYALFIFSFDRSVAGSLSTSNPLSNKIAFLKVSSILTTRIIIAVLIAAFVSLPLTIFLFKNSIKKVLFIDSKILTTEVDVELDKNKKMLVDFFSSREKSENCKALNYQREKIKSIMEEDARLNIGKNGQRYGKNQERLLKNLQNLDEKYNEMCSATGKLSPSEQSQIDVIKNKILHLENKKNKVSKNNIDLFSGQRGLDLLEQKRRTENADSFSPIQSTFKLLFALELMLIMLKLTMGSSYNRRYAEVEDAR